MGLYAFGSGPVTHIVFSGTVALTLVPGLVAAISNQPPSCVIRARIPANPTPKFEISHSRWFNASGGSPRP